MSSDLPVDFNCEALIASDKKRGFEALTINIDDWWGETSNPVVRNGDEFTVSWGEPWYRFKVLEFEPFTQLTWECVDSNQIIGGLEGVEKEWVGTKLYWTVEKVDGDMIRIKLIHHGLTPQFLCYDVCSNAWSTFIREKLKKFLEG